MEECEMLRGRDETATGCSTQNAILCALLVSLQLPEFRLERWRPVRWITHEEVRQEQASTGECQVLRGKRRVAGRSSQNPVLRARPKDLRGRGRLCVKVEDPKREESLRQKMK